VVESMPEKIFRRGTDGRSTAANPKHQVGYFVSCGFSFQYPEVVEATLRVLARNGCAVTVLNNTCCGRPASAYGDLEAARDIARKNIERLAPAVALDAVVSECGSCSTHLKDYGQLLKDDPVYAEHAAALARKIQSFSEFLAAIGTNGALGTLQGTVTYHDPCHLSNRFAKITAQPRKLLKSIPGVTYKEMPEADWCCGAAGSYTFLHHQEAVGVLDRKMGNVEKTGASILTTECPACMMHLAYGVRRRGLPIQVRHLSQLLDQAYESHA
jgi:glycolate oxidase iron-sulfur subunit